MSKSSLITVLALIASVAAKPYYYDYRPYAPRTAYTAAEFYNPAVSSAAYSAGQPAGYPTAYSYSSYPDLYAASLSGGYAAPLSLPTVSAYSNSYTLEGLAALYNPAPVAPVAAVAPVAPIAPVAPVAPLTYASYTSPAYSYYYKR